MMESIHEYCPNMPLIVLESAAIGLGPPPAQAKTRKSRRNRDALLLEAAFGASNPISKREGRQRSCIRVSRAEM